MKKHRVGVTLKAIEFEPVCLCEGDVSDDYPMRINVPKKYKIRQIEGYGTGMFVDLLKFNAGLKQAILKYIAEFVGNHNIAPTNQYWCHCDGDQCNCYDQWTKTWNQLDCE